MDREKMKEMLEKAVPEIDGKRRMPCAKAFMLAEEWSVPVREIGDCCNEAGIKIVSCQLGCF